MTKAYWCIDPVGGSDATGARGNTQTEAEQTPFKTWGALTWRTGDTYSQRRGTTALEQVIVGKTGELGRSIVLDAYGETGDTPVIDAEGIRDNCVQLIGKAYVIVRNLRLVRAVEAGCLQVKGTETRAPDGIVLEDLYCTDNAQGDGININHPTTVTAPARDIVIRRCECDDNGNSGISIGGNLDGVLVDRCNVRRNGHAQNSWGIHVEPYQTKFAPGEWRRISNWIYEVDLLPGEVGLTVSITQSSFDYRRMRLGNYAALGPNEFAQSGTTLRLNPNEDLSLHNSNFPIRVQLSRTKNVIIQDSVCEDQYSFDGFDGTGMGFDTFAQDSECRRCTVVRPSRQGFSLNDTDGTITLTGCEVVAPGQDTAQAFGAFFAARGGAGMRQFINCTAIGSTDSAFRFQDDVAAGTLATYEIHNALIENCVNGLTETVARTAINSSGIVVYNVANPGFASYTTSPVSNLATLTSPFLLQAGATAIGGGTVRVVSDPRDRRGVYRLTPDSGANYYVSAAPTGRIGLR